MAIVQALIAALTCSAGKLLNTVFAWATVLLFGRVSEDRQVYVSAIACGSVIWLIVLNPYTVGLAVTLAMVLTLFAGGATANLVADQMTMHPSDLVISGREAVAARGPSSPNDWSSLPHI